MATLEKIRSKSVFLIIVIGVALLAFIIGDALTNSRNLFGDQTTVAKIGGDKIDYTEYQRKREELNQQLEEARRQSPQQYASFDAQQLPQMAIDQLINEKLVDEAVEKTGIQTSGEQLRFYLIDNPMSDKVGTIIQQLNASGISVSTPQQAYDVIFNPERNNLTAKQMEPFQRAWIAIEEETKTLVKRNMYSRLLYGTVKANDLDKKALYNDYVAMSDVKVAYKPYGQLDEKKYPVSDAEIKKAYGEDKNLYAVEEPTKEVSFIAVSIMASDADRKAASALAQATLKELNDSSSKQISRDLKKEGVMTESRKLRASDLPAGSVKEFVTSAAPGQASLVSENMSGFTAVKMGRRTSAVDSIQLNLVQVSGAALPAKVLAKLNAGLPVDSISKAFPADSVMAQKEQWIALYTAQGPTNALQASQLDTLMAAGSRFVELVKMPEGSVLAQVTERKAPVEIYEFEELTYDLKPSAKTVADERAKLEKFLAANNTAAKFSANAGKAGYNVQNFDFTQSIAAVPRMRGMNYYYPDSRQVVRWVMIDAKTGDVSGIYESKDANAPALYAVAVDAEYDDYVPVANKDVKAALTDKVRRSKAGDDMVKQYSAKAANMQSAANAMGVEPTDAAQFRFGRNGVVRDAKVLGRIAGSKPAAKPVVMKGDDGVYVYQIVSQSTDKFPYVDETYEQQYMQMVNPDLARMLRGDKKVKNNAYKFEAGE